MSDIVSKVRDLAANCDGIKLKYLITLIKKVANNKVKLTDDENAEVFNLINVLCQSVKTLYPAVKTLFPEKLNLSQRDQTKLFTNIKDRLSTPYKSLLLVKKLEEIIPNDNEVQNHLFNEKLTKAKTDSKVLKKSLTTKEQIIKSNAEKLTKTEDELEVLKESLTTKEQIIKSNTEKLTKAENDLEILKESSATTEETLKLTLERLTKAENDLSVAQRDIKESSDLKEEALTAKSTTLQEMITVNCVNEDLNNVLKDKTNEIKTKDKIINKLNDTIKDLEETNVESKRDLTAKDDVITKQNNSLNELKERIRELEEDFENKKEEIVEDTLSDTQEEIVEDTLDDTQRQIVSIDRAIQIEIELTEIIERKDAEIEALKEETERITNENTSMKNEIAEVEHIKEEKNQLEIRTQKNIDKITSDYNAAKDTISGIKDELETKDHLIKDKEETIESLKGQMITLKEEAATSYDGLKAQLDQTNRDLTEAVIEKNNYQTNKTELENTNSRLSLRNKKLNLLYMKLGAGYEAKNNELRNHMKKCGDIHKKRAENSKKFVLNTVSDTVNETMGSLKQKLETSDFTKMTPKRLHDVGLPVAELPVSRRSLKRKIVASPQNVRQQKHKAS